MRWRRVPFRRYDPYVKTALNQVSIERVAATGQPMVWVAGWDRKTVNIGRSQSIEEEIDPDYAQTNDICIVRRQGGGGTTYLTPDGDITWQLVAPTELLPDDPNTIYAYICGQIADQLRAHGIEAEHEPINDIRTPAGKLSGATLKEQDDVIYLAGTMLYQVDPEEMFSVLTPDEEKLEDKAADAFEDRVTAIEDEAPISYEETIDLLYHALLRSRPSETRGWTDEEQKKAEKRAEELRQDKWAYQDE